MFSKEAYVIYKKKEIRDPEFDGRLMLLIAYIMMNANLKGHVGTTLETIIKDIGYIPNRHKGMINEVVIGHLKCLEECDHISIVNECSKITPKGFIQIRINKKSDLFNIGNEPYISLTEREYKKITTFGTGISRGTLLKVFLNIKSYINFDSKTASAAYPSQSAISQHCGVSLQTTNNAVKELVKMKVLFEHVTGAYKTKTGTVRNAVNAYAVKPSELKGIEQELIEYYKSKGVKIDSFIKRGAASII